jgi:hypothetical protein
VLIHRLILWFGIHNNPKRKLKYVGSKNAKVTQAAACTPPELENTSIVRPNRN